MSEYLEEKAIKKIVSYSDYPEDEISQLEYLKDHSDVKWALDRDRQVRITERYITQ